MLDLFFWLLLSLGGRRAVLVVDVDIGEILLDEELSVDVAIVVEGVIAAEAVWD